MFGQSSETDASEGRTIIAREGVLMTSLIPLSYSGSLTVSLCERFEGVKSVRE